MRPLREVTPEFAVVYCLYFICMYFFLHYMYFCLKPIQFLIFILFHSLIYKQTNKKDISCPNVTGANEIWCCHQIWIECYLGFVSDAILQHQHQICIISIHNPVVLLQNTMVFFQSISASWNLCMDKVTDSFIEKIFFSTEESHIHMGWHKDEDTTVFASIEIYTAI